MTADLFTRRFALATGANLVFFVGITSFFSLPVHLETLGATRAEIGRVMGAFGVASLAAIPITGALADRFGRRPFMVLGAVLWALASLGFERVHQTGALLYFLRLAQGVAFSLAFVSTNAVIVDLAPQGSLGRAIALFGATTLISHAIGPALGEWVARSFGFATLFRGSAAVALVALSAYLFIADVPRAPPSSPQRRVTMLQIAFRRGATGSLLAAVGAAVSFGAAINFMPVFVRERGLHSHAPFFVGYVVAAIAVRLAASGLGDRIGHRPVGAVGSLGFSLVSIGFAALSSRAELVILALLFGLAHGVAYPSMNALFVEGTPAAARGRAMALFNLAFNVGVTLAAFVAGEVAERFDYGVMWFVVGACALAGTGALLLDRPVIRGAGPTG